MQARSLDVEGLAAVLAEDEKGDDCGSCDNCRSGLTQVASERPLRDTLH